MKKLAFALATFLVGGAAVAQQSSPSWQNDESLLTRYAVQIDASGEGTEYGLVTLRQGGRLNVDRYLYKRSLAQPEFLGYETITLAERVENRLMGLIRNLSNAELQETRQDIVCMRVPPIGPNPALVVRRGWDAQKKAFTGKPKMIMDNTGCWAHYHVKPKHQWHENEARRLMTMVETLVLQSLAQ